MKVYELLGKIRGSVKTEVYTCDLDYIGTWESEELFYSNESFLNEEYKYIEIWHGATLTIILNRKEY